MSGPCEPLGWFFVVTGAAFFLSSLLLFWKASRLYIMAGKRAAILVETAMRVLARATSQAARINAGGTPDREALPPPPLPSRR
jgi:hypothetical protein